MTAHMTPMCCQGYHDAKQTSVSHASRSVPQHEPIQSVQPCLPADHFTASVSVCPTHCLQPTYGLTCSRELTDGSTLADSCVTALHHVQGFETSREWRGRYIFLSGYCDLLVNGGGNILKRQDLDDLQKVAWFKNNTVAERVLALFTRGVASWSMSDRGEAARMYRRAISMASNASTQDRSAPVITTGHGPGGVGFYRQSAGKLIDYYAKKSQQNLDILTGAANRETDPGVGNPMYKRTMWPVVANSAEERDAQQRQMDNAMRMRSEECAQCAKKREDVALKTCNRCGLVWYCGAECQRRHWKAVHRRKCREPKDFHAGDVVRLSGLDATNKELEDHFVVVVEQDAAAADSWRVAHDRLLPAVGKVVQASQMQRMLTE